MSCYLYSLTEHRAVDASGSGCSKFWVWESERRIPTWILFGSPPHCLLVNSSSPIFVGSLVPGTSMFGNLGEKKLFLIMFVKQWFCGKGNKTYQSKDTLHLPIKHMSCANALKNDLMFGAWHNWRLPRKSKTMCTFNFQPVQITTTHGWYLTPPTPEPMDGFQWIWTLQTKQTHSEPCQSNRSHFHPEIIILQSS